MNICSWIYYSMEAKLGPLIWQAEGRLKHLRCCVVRCGVYGICSGTGVFSTHFWKDVWKGKIIEVDHASYMSIKYCEIMWQPARAEENRLRSCIMESYHRLVFRLGTTEEENTGRLLKSALLSSCNLKQLNVIFKTMALIWV